MSDSNFMPPPPPSFENSGYSGKVGEKVTFGNVLQVVFQKYTVGKGRATRSEYWFFYLWTVIIYFGGLMATGIASGISEDLVGLVSISWLLVLCALIIPHITVMVRRLHDTNKSAHYLWFSLLPFVGGIALFIFMVQESDQGSNNYGPQPN